MRARDSGGGICWGLHRGGRTGLALKDWEGEMTLQGPCDVVPAPEHQQREVLREGSTLSPQKNVI